ncbi:MAG: hypothetical protein JXR76_26700 [Deltaproteobacteria bacterium]|nr:hypothetical protein [Deltaproteobacteria bacterium]
MSCGKSNSDASRHTADTGSVEKISGKEKASGKTVECPVCGLTFRESEAVGTAEHSGKTYYFFLEDHKQAFLQNPENYTGKDTSSDDHRRHGTAEQSGETR